MTRYKIIQTAHFKKSLESFLSSITIPDKNSFKKFQNIFDYNPFDKRLKTHSIFKNQDAALFSSYITTKIRLIRILKWETIILLYQIMTDHDYNKIQKLAKHIIWLSSFIT